MFKELNPIIHSQLRLAVMTILMSVEEADFNYLKEKTEASAGNLSVQLDKLSTAGYIEITKEFVGKKNAYDLPYYTKRKRCAGRICQRIKDIFENLNSSH